MLSSFAGRRSVGFPMIESQGPIDENACHEGNYGLRFVLSAARAEERAEPAGAQK